MKKPIIVAPVSLKNIILYWIGKETNFFKDLDYYNNQDFEKLVQRICSDRNLALPIRYFIKKLNYSRN